MPFPGNWIFPGKIRESSISSIWEDPLPGPDSVPAFGTGFFPSRLSPKNETEIPKFKLHIKIQDLSWNSVLDGKFPVGY